MFRILRCSRPMNETAWAATAILALLAMSATSVVAAPEKKAKKLHRHRVVEIPGEPVLTPLNISLQNPRRILMDAQGGILIADSAANKVFRIDPAGKVATLAAGLKEPSGLCLDPQGRCCFSNHADGQAGKGSVVRIEPDGKQTVLAGNLTGPKGLCFGPGGKLYVALFDENRIVTIDEKGTVAEFAREINTPAALCFDRQDNLLAVNSVQGTVTKITPQKKISLLCRGLKIPSDIAVGSQGEIVVANYAGTHLTRVFPSGKTVPYLAVPAGTIGLGFDKAGNLLLVNWEKSWALRAKIWLSVPCPHCRKPIPVRIRPHITPASPSKKII